MVYERIFWPITGTFDTNGYLALAQLSFSSTITFFVLKFVGIIDFLD